MSFRVNEVITNYWENTLEVRCVMQSDSELLCYKQALELQKALTSDPGSPIGIHYEVEEK